MPPPGHEKETDDRPKGNQVASGARSSAIRLETAPPLRSARTATPTRLGKCPRKGLQSPSKTRPGTGRGDGSGDVLEVQIGTHFEEQFGRRFSRQKSALFRLQKREPNLPSIQPLISPQIHRLTRPVPGRVL